MAWTLNVQTPMALDCAPEQDSSHITGQHTRNGGSLSQLRFFLLKFVTPVFQKKRMKVEYYLLTNCYLFTKIRRKYLSKTLINTQTVVPHDKHGKKIVSSQVMRCIIRGIKYDFSFINNH